MAKIENPALRTIAEFYPECGNIVFRLYEDFTYNNISIKELSEQSTQLTGETALTEQEVTELIVMAGTLIESYLRERKKNNTIY